MKTKPLEFKERPPYLVSSVGATTLTCSAFGFPEKMDGAFYDLYGNRIASDVTTTEDVFTINTTVSRSGSYRCEIKYDTLKIEFVTTADIFTCKSFSSKTIYGLLIGQIWISLELGIYNQDKTIGGQIWCYCRDFQLGSQIYLFLCPCSPVCLLTAEFKHTCDCLIMRPAINAEFGKCINLWVKRGCILQTLLFMNCRMENISWNLIKKSGWWKKVKINYSKSAFFSKNLQAENLQKFVKMNALINCPLFLFLIKNCRFVMDYKCNFLKIWGLYDQKTQDKCYCSKL